jgi:hypothetical protein
MTVRREQLLVLAILASWLLGRPVHSATGLLEGDMAVPTRRNGDPSIGNQADLWIGGRVLYRFEKMELKDGEFEDIFTDGDMAMIREVLQEISDTVPCIEFL